MKKEYKVLVLSCVFVFMFSSLAYAMSWEEFIETYPNEYIYRMDFPNGDRNYLSSPCELEFRIVDTGERKVFRVYKKVPNDLAVTILGEDGTTAFFRSNYLEYGEHRIVDDTGEIKGVDIWRWNGYGFFLSEPSAILRPLVGLIRTILPVGFGILSVSLLIRLLTVYFRRFLYRST